MVETKNEGSLKVAVIVVAAGCSRRMGFDKITTPLCGRPLVTWALEAFNVCPDIFCGVLVCSSERQEELAILASPYEKFRKVVAGGASRADSVFNGLDALSDFAPEIVIVHDAARPLVTPLLISSVIEAAVKYGAAATAEPVSDTLHRSSDSGVMVETISRENLWAMQTPQAARFSDLQAALQLVRETNQEMTDEVSALLAIGVKPHVIAHEGCNFKITYQKDLKLAAAVLSQCSLGNSQ